MIPLNPQIPEGFRLLTEEEKMGVIPEDVISCYLDSESWGPSSFSGKRIPLSHWNWHYATRATLPAEAKGDPQCGLCFGYGWIIRPVNGVRCGCAEEPPEPTASESSGDVHLARALAEIERLKAELEQSSEIINLNISTEFRLRNELAAAHAKLEEAKAISQKHSERTKELARQLEQRGIDLDAAHARLEVEIDNRKAIEKNRQGWEDRAAVAERALKALATPSPAPVAGKISNVSSGVESRHPQNAVGMSGPINREARSETSDSPTDTSFNAPIAVGEKDSAGPTPIGGPPEGWRVYAENLARKLGEMEAARRDEVKRYTDEIDKLRPPVAGEGGEDGN
jgi:hypothetical protein